MACESILRVLFTAYSEKSQKVGPHFIQNCEKSRSRKPISSHDDVFYIFHYFSILFGRTKITIIFEEINSSFSA